jgi:hypothetical protein
MKDPKSQKMQLASIGIKIWLSVFKSYLYLLEKTFQQYLDRPGFENNAGNNGSHANCEIVCCKCYDGDAHSSVALGPFCGCVEVYRRATPLKR